MLLDMCDHAILTYAMGIRVRAFNSSVIREFRMFGHTCIFTLFTCIPSINRSYVIARKFELDILSGKY